MTSQLNWDMYMRAALQSVHLVKSRVGQASDEHANLNDRCELSGDATALRHFVRGRAS